MTHTLLVCSGRRRVPPAVLRHPLVRCLSVVTETGHPDIYDSDTRIETVENIEDPGAVLRAAMRLNRSRPIDNVLTPFETGLASGAFIRSQLGLPGTDFHTATGFTNKYAMKRRLQAAGIDVMPFRLAQDCAQALEQAASLGFPVVLKPVCGGGSIGVAVCEDPAEVEQWWAERSASGAAPAALVERRADLLAEYHLDAVVAEGVVEFSVASRYSEPSLANVVLRHPYASYQLPADHPGGTIVTGLHARAVAALGLHSGVTHMEVFETPDGWLVSEIACRAAGGAIPEAIAMRHGPDLFDHAIRLSLAESGDLSASVPRHRFAYFGHAALGVTPGRITRISTHETFADLPGVVEIDIRSKPGEVIPESFYSGTASGYVYAGADNEAEMRRTLDEIRRRHVIDTTTP